MSRPSPHSHQTGFVARCAALLLLGALASLHPLPAAEFPASSVMQPDYTGITLPPNIAPLNFKITVTGRTCRATFQPGQGQPLVLTSSDGRFRIPAGPWREMLNRNIGGYFRVEIAVENHAGQWQALPPATNHIAPHPLDPWLVYRQLRPLYNLYARMGIYQRHLESFTVREILDNQRIQGHCLNCHTLLQQSPQQMFFHTRGVPGNPIILGKEGRLEEIAKTGGYASWHPSGRLVVYSVNKLSLFFHTRGSTRDVHDADSDLNVLHLDTCTVAAPPPIAMTNRLETWPCWSPDGRHLYFCSAEPLPKERFREVRYDLMRVTYDNEHEHWGQPETVVSARDLQLSTAQPRVSPDGRWLLFTAFNYGNFPVYQTNADLYLLNLTNHQMRRLEINSEHTDSWHCWSSNSRWLVFSSKRRDGVFSFPYFAFLDDQGAFSKPFLLPQEDPDFYDTFIKNFNLPEFATAPVPFQPDELAEFILHPPHKIQPLPDPQFPPRQRRTDQGAAQ